MKLYIYHGACCSLHEIWGDCGVKIAQCGSESEFGSGCTDLAYLADLTKLGVNWV